jgi:CBS domain-containing protein
MQCREVMLTLVYTCRENDPVSQPARLMRDEHIGFVPVIDERGAVKGVITDRDLAVRVLAEDKPASTRVSEVMSVGGLLTCHADEDLHVLETRMAQQKKGRALVLDDQGHLAGVISLSDIAQAETSAQRSGALLRSVTHRESVAIARP